ncbi:MAG: type II toxin-antitoxin system RelE/ParE family toxin [Thermoplasmata archaeon]
MSCEVLLHPKCAKALRKRTKGKLRELASRPERGKLLRCSDFRILRIGDHGALYEIDEAKKAVVLFIGHRKKVYDDFSKLF